MKNILITGSNGFIGKNLIFALKELGTYNLLLFDTSNQSSELDTLVSQADFIIHLAGVNKPKYNGELREGNIILTQKLINSLKKHNKCIPVIATSSTQVTLDNPYGQSKLAMENLLLDWAKSASAPVLIYRLSNVFGKWCCPNYNSVVATFCHRLSQDLPLEVDDGEKLLQLISIDDVVAAFIQQIESPHPLLSGLCSVSAVYPITISELADKLNAFQELRKNLTIPDLSSPLDEKLYYTYISYINVANLLSPLTQKDDDRGTLFEFMKSDSFGQIFVSKTLPGITRGGHYHHQKVEKFLVLQGTALIELTHVTEGINLKTTVTGTDALVIDIPPGYTHSITNIGETELLTLFWSSQIFDESHPDTYSPL